MNIVIVAGRIRSVPRPTEGARGVRWSFDLTRDGSVDEPAWTVPVVCDGSSRVATEVATLEVGAQVTVVGTVQRRFFRVGPSTQSRTEVVATDVVLQRARRRTQIVLRREADRLGAAAGGEVSSAPQRAGGGRRGSTQREQES